MAATAPKTREEKQGRPKGHLDPKSITSFYAGLTVGDKNVEWDILPAGLTDGAEIAAMKRKLRQRISPVIARIKAHPKHCNKDYATHSGFAVCENGDMVITVIVERIK